MSEYKKPPHIEVYVKPVFVCKPPSSYTIEELKHIVKEAELKNCSHVQFRVFEKEIFLFFNVPYIKYENDPH